MSFLKGCGHGRRGLHARDDNGATAVEYELMAALIALATIIGAILFGASVKGLFNVAVANSPFS